MIGHPTTKVSFDDVLTVRWYNTVLGDHPSAIDGPPVSIGWDFTTEKIPTEDADDDSWIDAFGGGSRHGEDFHLDARQRIERLAGNGVSSEEMERAVAEAKCIREFRKVHTIRRSQLPRTSSTAAIRQLCGGSDDDLPGRRDQSVIDAPRSWSDRQDSELGFLWEFLLEFRRLDERMDYGKGRLSDVYLSVAFASTSLFVLVCSVVSFAGLLLSLFPPGGSIGDRLRALRGNSQFVYENER